MLIQSLVAHSVRNLRDVTLVPTHKFTILVGNNGQGKTNLLETIYLVSALRSFRTSKLAEMVAIGQSQAQVQAIVELDGIRRHYQVDLIDGRRKATIDGKAARPVASYFGAFNVVVFTPEDLYTPRSTPAARRRFLDRAVFNDDVGYLATSSDYERVLKSRNAILRQHADRGASAANLAMLDVFTSQLVELGSKIINDRKLYLANISQRVRQSYETITRSGMQLEVRYQTEFDDSSQLAAAMVANRAKDLARGTTSCGPHRDDLQFLLNGNQASEFASQGQLRAMVLAWKAAEIDLIRKRRGKTPILLLDDVSSELDAQRNQFLFEHLCSVSGQCFITTTDEKHVLIPSDSSVFRVENGLLVK